MALLLYAPSGALPVLHILLYEYMYTYYKWTHIAQFMLAPIPRNPWSYRWNTHVVNWGESQGCNPSLPSDY